MAFYNQDDQDEEQNNASGMNQSQEQQSNGSAPVQLSGQSSSISTGQQGQATQAPKSASSGAAPGFQNYAKANQGTAQNKLNSAVAQNVANQGQAAKSAINQANTAFNQQVDAGSLANRQNALQDVSNTISSARNLQAGAQVDQNQQNRFKEVVNAQYQGPESLRQSGLYNKAVGKVNTAQQALNNTGTASGREELLKNMYQQRADYTAGLGKLDSALLNASQQGVQNLQNTAKAQGNVRQQLDQAQIGSTQTSQNRAAEIANIRNQAKQAFTEGKKAEEAATAARLDNVVADWNKLPDHFKKLLAGEGEVNGQTILNNKINEIKASQNYQQLANQAAQAAAALKAIPQYRKVGGVLGNVRILNPTYQAAKKNYDAIVAKQNAPIKELKNSFNKDAVYLSPEEAAVLGVNSGEGLYNLGANAIATANADKQRLISKDEQARQAALSSLAGLDQSHQLDTNLLYNNAALAGTQDATDALDLAQTRANINAAEKNFREGVDRNIVGTGMKKNKSSGKKYYADAKANLKDVFEKAGYDFDADYSDNVGQGDLRNAFDSVKNAEASSDPSGLGGAIDGYAGTITNMGDGQSLGQNALDAYGHISGINALTGALGMGSLGNALGGVFGATNSRASKNKAKELAYKDLNKKVNRAIDASGFNNRLAVSNDGALDTRTAALQQLLDSLDKTNS